MKVHFKVHRTCRQGEGYHHSTIYEPMSQRVIQSHNEFVDCFEDITKKRNPDTMEQVDGLEENIEYLTKGSREIEVNPVIFNEIFRKKNLTTQYEEIIQKLEELRRKEYLDTLHLTDKMVEDYQDMIIGK